MMAFRRDLPYFDVSLARFQDFDHGKVIGQNVPINWALEPGDVLEWDCAQFYGTTEVVSCGEPVNGSVRCKFKKLT